MAMVVKSETITDPYLHAYEAREVSERLLAVCQMLSQGCEPKSSEGLVVEIKVTSCAEAQTISVMNAPFYIRQKFTDAAIENGCEHLLTRELLRETFRAMVAITQLPFKETHQPTSLSGVQLMVHTALPFMRVYSRNNSL